VLAAGCAEELGPERRVTTRVTGVVREGARPVGGGWVEFWPTDGTVGDLRSAPIGPDGRFDADGVAVGRNRVGLVAVPSQVPNCRFYFDPLRTSIRRDVPAGPRADLTIDLYQELAKRAAQTGR
jgi:hypothetical protein